MRFDDVYPTDEVIAKLSELSGCRVGVIPFMDCNPSTSYLISEDGKNVFVSIDFGGYCACFVGSGEPGPSGYPISPTIPSSFGSPPSEYAHPPLTEDELTALQEIAIRLNSLYVRVSAIDRDWCRREEESRSQLRNSVPDDCRWDKDHAPTDQSPRSSRTLSSDSRQEACNTSGNAGLPGLLTRGPLGAITDLLRESLTRIERILRKDTPRTRRVPSQSLSSFRRLSDGSIHVRTDTIYAPSLPSLSIDELSGSLHKLNTSAPQPDSSGRHREDF